MKNKPSEAKPKWVEINTQILEKLINILYILEPCINFCFRRENSVRKKGFLYQTFLSKFMFRHTFSHSNNTDLIVCSCLCLQS